MDDHEYLQDSMGVPLKLVRMTEELCPSCNPSSQGAKLGIYAETATTETIQCVHCDYGMTRPRRDPVGRKMNSSR